jgi:hypothetical protein
MARPAGSFHKFHIDFSVYALKLQQNRVFNPEAATLGKNSVHEKNGAALCHLLIFARRYVPVELGKP